MNDDGEGTAEIAFIQGGVLDARRNTRTGLIVVLSHLFPWSPTIMTAHYKLKVFISSQSPLVSLAQAYYKRFDLDVVPAHSCTEFHKDCQLADVVIDEGWQFNPFDLRRFSRVGREKIFLRLNQGYNFSLDNLAGKTRHWTVGHVDVGGVTDLVSTVYQWYSADSDEEIKISTHCAPTRDLRSMLKAGVDGQSSPKPVFISPTPVNKVVRLRPGVVSAVGLFPLSEKLQHLPQVRTAFGSKLWVTRDLVSSEVLGLKDIPEPIFLLVKSEENEKVMTRNLFDSCRVPLKSLSALLLPILEQRLKVPIIKDEVHASPAAAVKKHKVMEIPERIVDNYISRSIEAIDSSVLEEQELSCQTGSELSTLLADRLKFKESESRSKRSDYELPSETIWDIRVLVHVHCLCVDGRAVNWRGAFLVIRRFLLYLWKRSMMRSILRYRRSLDGEQFGKEDADALRDCARRIGFSTFWAWDGGSRGFFWNWPPALRTNIRDGFLMWLRSSSVNWMEAQPKPTDKALPLMRKKLDEVRDRRYIDCGSVKSLIRFFGVPKGDSDIRMVYDGTRSGLNAALWAPWFPLPTASSHLRIVDASSWMADNDAGEFFLNWMMDEKIRCLCGVDLTHFLAPNESSEMRKKGEKLHVERWNRCAMGLRPSPYLCVKGMLLAKEIIMGDRTDLSNVFRWDHVLLNLPGMAGYDPGKPWVSKRRSDGTLAADLISFVDDLRPVAPSESECWEASQRVSTQMATLGLQDASRKRNPPSQTPGPWAGMVVTTNDDGVYISVSQKKWDKAKEHVAELLRLNETGMVAYKLLESRTGYLVYVAQAYPCMKPYLIGLYGTLNSWRSGWDESGWKSEKNRKRRKLEVVGVRRHRNNDRDFEVDENWHFQRYDLEDDKTEGDTESSLEEGGSLETPPQMVQFVKRASDDLEALALLLEGDVPSLRKVRGGGTVSLLYGFGDASGKGFGSALQKVDGQVYYQAGLWGETFSENMSSNYRELRNLVDFVHKAADEGVLDGCQLLLFTDNIVADLAFHKGGSKSEKIHELVLKLRKLEMSLSAELIVVHISGLRMIESGVDGISRGDMNAGIMAGQAIESFMPLHLHAIDRSVGLLGWILSWAGQDAELLTCHRWPDHHADSGTYIWAPAPAAASAVVDYLGDSIHKRSTSIHIVVVPRIMTSMWRKNLGKTSDIQFQVDCGCQVWPQRMFEPLIIFISLPISRYCQSEGSWRFKGSQRVRDLELALPRMWESDFSSVGSSLRKLLSQARDVRAL